MEVKEPITEYGALDLSKRYTFSDYLNFQFKERVELIRGWIYAMSPAPKKVHQRISIKLVSNFLIIEKKGNCEVFHAPFDVRLPIPSEEKQYTVVQPDICVFCDPDSKTDELGGIAAPDLIVEILSINKKHDTVTKFELYAEAGVPEYWIVDPDDQTIIIYTLQNGQYAGSRLFQDELIIQSKSFPQIKFETSAIF